MRVHTLFTALLLLSEGFPDVVLGQTVHEVFEGKDVTVKCLFKLAGSSRIFCKNDCFEKIDVLVETHGNSETNGRYSLRYENKEISVSIKKVQVSDSGRYWCKLDRTLLFTDSYVEFRIQVIKGPPPVEICPINQTTVRRTQSPGPDPNISPSPDPRLGPDPGPEPSGSSVPLIDDDQTLSTADQSLCSCSQHLNGTVRSEKTDLLLLVGLTLAVSVNLFTVFLLILFRRKKNKPQDFSVNADPAFPEVDRDFEEAPEQQVQGRSNSGSDIYSLTSVSAHAQDGTVQYSEVNFTTKSAPCSLEETVVYSTVRHEEALYGNVP